jgi:AcrR family transcriptional regulator
MNQPDTTPARLLEAGRKLFSEKGFDGASVRAITQHASANLAAITYHFGSKQRLYTAVLEQLFGSLAERVEAATTLPQVVQAFFSFFSEYPEAPRLMIRHLASAGGPPEAALPHFRRVLQRAIGLVREGQARGELRAVEPLLAVFTLVSQTVWFAVMRRSLAAVSGVPMDRPEMAEVVQRHITDVLRRTLDPAQGAA